KKPSDRQAILQGVLNGHIDVIATDHAPHTFEEKSRTYLEAPSGGPLVQHALQALLDLVHQKKMTLTDLVQKTAHNTATLFQIEYRVFILVAYCVDVVVFDLNKSYLVSRNNILSKCCWSPFENH